MDKRRVDSYTETLRMCDHELEHERVRIEYADVIEWLREQNESLYRAPAPATSSR